uniref:Large ribosomal subunit protein bL20c n=1 Tax=Phacus inflexus TaxID=461210 RepID=A0A3G3LKT4_9EUGL|nr:ribosomal protein L20 [Phacus inflexus]AYQ93325.1 ribosomal protein L20 [Phacus inflexus]
MTRVKRAFVSRRRHKKIISSNKGFTGSHSKLFKVANQEYMKSLVYSYSDRRKKKRNFKSLWIRKINAVIREVFDTKYNTLISKLKKSKIILNKKILANISMNDRKTLSKLVNFN